VDRSENIETATLFGTPKVEGDNAKSGRGEGLRLPIPALLFILTSWAKTTPC
jgi:hypothetical protein